MSASVLRTSTVWPLLVVATTVAFAPPAGAADHTASADAETHELVPASRPSPETSGTPYEVEARNRWASAVLLGDIAPIGWSFDPSGSRGYVFMARAGAGVALQRERWLWFAVLAAEVTTHWQTLPPAVDAIFAAYSASYLQVQVGALAATDATVGFLLAGGYGPLSIEVQRRNAFMSAHGDAAWVTYFRLTIPLFMSDPP
jgi:hypothetical protein